MRPIDLSVPIYLNQQIVFDLLAILDDGFSALSTIKTSSSESETNKYGMGASIGVSNVFALLGISFSGERGKEKGTQGQTEVSQEKVHTPTSLFAKLRYSLQEKELLRSIAAKESLSTLAAGDFIEFRALLRKNPLVETIEGFKQMMEMATLFQTASTAAPATGRQSSKQKTKQPQGPVGPLAKQLDGMLAALNQSNSIELIGELLDAPETKAVLTARPDFFSQSGAAEIIDGEFRVLGKIVRIVAGDTNKTINLLRKTAFGRFDRKIFDQISQGLGNLEAAGLRSTKLVTEIEGPAMLVLPIAIFT